MAKARRAFEQEQSQKTHKKRDTELVLKHDECREHLRATKGCRKRNVAGSEKALANLKSH